MDWKDEYNKQFPTVDHQYPNLVKSFINTEIIEKLIEDIPDNLIHGYAYTIEPMKTDSKKLKDQLRAKWLSNKS